MFSGLDFFTGVDFEDTFAFVAACGGGGADQDRAEEEDGLELHGGEVVVVVVLIEVSAECTYISGTQAMLASQLHLPPQKSSRLISILIPT